MRSINRELTTAGIEIAFPQRDVHIRSAVELGALPGPPNP